MDITKTTVGTVIWRGQEIPVTADFNDRGQPVGFPRVQIADMPPAMREAVRHWATEIRIVKMGMPPTGCAYYLEDIEEFLTWEQTQAAGVGEEFITWMIDGFEDDGSTITLNLQQVDTFDYRGLAVPVWQVADRKPGDRCYPGRFVRYMDLPEDLHQAFARWQYGANQPFAEGAYDYDFRHFMDRGGRGFSGDFSDVVRRYL